MGDEVKRLGGIVDRFPWAVTGVLVIILWHCAARYNWVGPTLLASPYEVVEALVNGFGEDATKQARVHVHALYTIGRALEGWVIALLIGIVVGTSVGVTSLVFRGLESLLEFIRAIPPVLALPLLLVAFNFGETAYTWTIVFGCMSIATLAVARGTHSVSRERLEVLHVFQVSRGIRYFAVCMEVLPSVFLAARLTLSYAIIIAVVCEMVFTPRNGWALGALARDAEIDFNTPRFFACVLLIGAFGFCANWILKRIEFVIGIQESKPS